MNKLKEKNKKKNLGQIFLLNPNSKKNGGNKYFDRNIINFKNMIIFIQPAYFFYLENTYVEQLNILFSWIIK